MVKSRTPFPKEGDFVMGRVVEIQNQYVYVDLIDYEGLPSEACARGLIHISEVSSRWIKNMRNYVRINQLIVVRVLKVTPEKGHVDCSLRRVNSAQKDSVKKERKFAMRYENLLEFLSEETGMTLDELYDKIGFPILDRYRSYQEALDDLKENGEKILDQFNNISDDIKKKYLRIIDENVEISTVNIIGKIRLSFVDENGIEHIRDTLLNALKVVENPKDTRKVDISYIATPFYRLEIVSKDYIDAEGILSSVIEVIENKAHQHEGQFEFIRD